MSLRLVRALVPVLALYVGKLIIDDVVQLVQMPNRPDTVEGWLASGHLEWLAALLGAEFALAALSDVLIRVVSLVDGLLSEKATNASSVSLMTAVSFMVAIDWAAQCGANIGIGLRSRGTGNAMA